MRKLYKVTTAWNVYYVLAKTEKSANEIAVRAELKEKGGKHTPAREFKSIEYISGCVYEK